MNTIGKYKIVKELGSGGFGAVYLCEDQLGQQVAIKIFQPKDDVIAGAATSATSDPGEVLKQRFKEEAKILHQLSDNTYIVNFMHYDELEDGTPYYVMPFLDRSLVEEIGKDAFSVGAREDLDPELFPRKLPLARALEVLEQTAKALRAVHRAGLVHRDVKPANILLDKTGQVQLCDFGIAKLPDTEHSQSGVGMGSRNYMSPEQRESAKHVKGSSDIYSLGVIAYRMITGVLPQGRFDDPIALSPGIGEGLNDLILQCIEFEPEKRPHDASLFLSTFKQATDGADTNNPNEDDETGTWIEEGASGLKDELLPLYEKIKEAWLNDGEIDTQEQQAFEASAAIFDLSEEELETLIQQVYSDHAKDIRKVQNFVKFIDARISEQVTPDTPELNAHTLRLLKDSANDLGWSQTKLETLLTPRIQDHLLKQGSIQSSASEQDSSAKSKSTSKAKNKPQHSAQPSEGPKKPKPAIMLLIIGLLVIGALIVGYNGFVSDQIDETRTQQLAEKEQASNDKAANDNLVEIEKEKQRQKQISQAQKHLSQLGYHVSQNGTLDTRTKAAIKQFEKSENIIQTGEVDEILLKALSRAVIKEEARRLKEKTAADAERKREQEKLTLIRLIKATQIELNRIGYGVGVADGAIGPKTKKAISHFQKSKQLNQSGEVSESLLALLERTTQKTRSAGESYKDCSNCPEMVVIPAGSFKMGSTNGDDDEKPVHQVNIAKPFAMGKYEVTKGQFAQFVKATGYKTDAEKNVGGADGCYTQEEGEWEWRAGREWRSPGFSQKQTQPVVCVSWTDSQAYVKWLNKKTGKHYRLPSESEWEYAVRAGSTTKYHFGNNGNKLCTYGNGADRTESPRGTNFKNKAECNDGYWFTAPVGSYKANAFGLYDMHGNVWEWVQDCYEGNYNKALKDGRAYEGGECARSVLRGGSWGSRPENLRSANRNNNGAAYRNSSIGFRLAQDL